MVAPLVQDDIYLVTQSGDLQLVAQGAALPFPALGVSVNESLSVPEDAFEKPLRLSVELVAGAERRPLFRDHWDLAMVTKGSPLRLEYAYDANQVFHLELKLAQFPESLPFQTRIENPLSHVVNPNRQQEEIDRLEEEYRQDPRKAEDLVPRIAELCAELGQHDKAIGLVRALLRQANRPVAWLINRQAMYEEARGNAAAAICGYEEAAPAYQTLKLRIRQHLKTDLDVTTQAQHVLASFGEPAALDNWELGWYICAADLADDREARQLATQLRRALNQTGAVDAGGVRPDMCRAPE